MRTHLLRVALSVAVAGCGDAGGGDGGAAPSATKTIAATTGTGRPSVGCADCIVLEGGTVFDGQTAVVGTVVMEGTRIREIVAGEVDVVDGERIDVSGKTVMPGLFDLHVHTRGDGAPYAYVAGADHTEAHLKARLRSGVTSMLDLGSAQSWIFALRDRLRGDDLLGPNLFAAGPLFTPHGGHPCLAGSPPADFCRFVDVAADVGPALGPVIADDPDVIKVVIEAGTESRPLPRMDDAAARALGEAVNAAGEKGIAHVSEARDMVLALDAGIRAFAHIPGHDRIDAALADRLRAEGAVVVPTLAVYDALHRISQNDLAFVHAPGIADDVPAEILAAFDDPSVLASMQTPAIAALYRTWWENASANVRTLVEHGVIVAAGTDAGNPGTFHGLSTLREVALLAENGMTPTQALAAATRNAADFLGRADLGRLAPDAIADVLVVDGDATSDVTAVSRTAIVFRAGARVDRDALRVGEPTRLARDPAVTQPENAVCIAPSECDADHYCGYLGSCAPACSFSVPCAVGAACFPQAGSTSKGFCYPGDGCDPLLQGCDNGAACIWLGNGATLCWTAGVGEQDDACPDGTCAPGYACDFVSARCHALCDPAATPSTCVAGTHCVDVSADAGLPLGECVPD